MRRALYGLGILLLCLSTSIQSEVTMAVFNVKPWGYIDERGQVAGYYLSLIRDFERQLGIKITFKLGPYLRVLQDISSGDADFAILIDDPDSAGIAYRLAPLPVIEVVFVLRSGLSLAKLKVLPEPRIGRVIGAYYQEVGQLLPAASYVGVPNIESGFAMLAMGRVDALVFTDTALELLTEKGVDLPLNEFAVEKIGSIRAALYLSKNSDKAVDLARYRAIAHQVVDEMTSVKIGPEAQQAKSLFIKKKNK